MKKYIIIFGLFLALAWPAAAFSGNISETFTYNSRFVRNDVRLTIPVTYFLTAGGEFSLNNTKYYSDNIMTFLLPLAFKADMVNILVKPFYVNDTDGLNAKGANLTLAVNLREDTANALFTQAYISVSYAEQKAEVARAAAVNKEYYKQLAYTLGIKQNFYDTFFFTLSGDLFQYPSGISNVEGIAMVLDQNYLADLGTYSTVLGLPKYSAGIRLARGLENKSTIYLSYKFTEFYLSGRFHSVTLGNEFPLMQKLWADLGYNHTIENDGKKRDFFRAAVKYNF